MVEILDGKVGKSSVELVKYGINNSLLSHCEKWSHFTHSPYLRSPSPLESTDAIREIT